MRVVTGEIFVLEHLILPQGVVPLCEDSSLRAAVLATLPTLDDGGLAVHQTRGDPDRGIQIPGAFEEQAVPSAAGSGPSAKGKQVVAGSSAVSGPSLARISSGASPEEPSRRRLHRSDRATEDAGQGSSRGKLGVAAPPPPPTDRASLWWQLQPMF